MILRFSMVAMALGSLAACGGAGSAIEGLNFVTQPEQLSFATDEGEANDTQEPVAVPIDTAFALTDDDDFASGPAFVTEPDDTDFAGILNDLRISRGHDTLNWDARLNAAAQKYAEEQSTLGVGVLSHVGVDGSTLAERITAEGYIPLSAAENLAKGYQTEAAVLQGWIDSPGHNQNLNRDLEDFALGVAGSGSNLSWVLILATEMP